MDLEQHPSPNHSGLFKAPPWLLVMHFTASGNGIENDAAFFADPAKTSASAHLLVGRDGSVIQCVQFDHVAHHAGVSSWRGQMSCNRFSIGVEIDNWGKLTRGADGAFRSWTGVVVAASAVVEAHGYWEAYPEAQLRVVEYLCREIAREVPSIREMAGHEDIAPGRKIDPGPAFPMWRFKSLVESRK